MFIRLKTDQSNDINVNVNSIAAFFPNTNGEGTVLKMTNGVDYFVSDSTRSIRSYIKKLSKVSSVSHNDSDNSPVEDKDDGPTAA